MAFELHRRPREPHGNPGPPALRVTLDRKRIIITTPAMKLLPPHVARVHLAIDEGDQALGLVPARDDDEKAYAVTRNGRQGVITAVGFIREKAIAAGRYRAESAPVLGKNALVAHYVRSDRVE